MRVLLTSALVISLSAPAFAEDKEDGFNLLEEGAQMILRGLMQEMEPAMDDLQSMMEDLGPALDDFATELGPVLAELLNKIDDISHYEQPEVLPNGDIIIRRSPDAPALEQDIEENGIEL